VVVAGTVPSPNIKNGSGRCGGVLGKFSGKQRSEEEIAMEK